MFNFLATTVPAEIDWPSYKTAVEAYAQGSTTLILTIVGCVTALLIFVRIVKVLAK